MFARTQIPVETPTLTLYNNAYLIKFRGAFFFNFIHGIENSYNESAAGIVKINKKMKSSRIRWHSINVSTYLVSAI